MSRASTQALLRQVARLEVRAGKRQRADHPLLAELRQDPARLMAAAGITPDPWQEELLRSSAARTLLLVSRQSGKSSTAATLALRTALLRPGAPVLLLSPSLRQSGEVFRKVMDLFGALGRPMAVAAESALRLELANGSQVVSLPGDERVQPRRLHRQVAHPDLAAALPLSPAVVRPDPAPYPLADVPGRVVPDQHEHPRPDGVDRLGGLGLLSHAAQARGGEGRQGVADCLHAPAASGSAVGGALPRVAGQEDRTAAQGEGVGGAEALPEGGTLRFVQGPDEQGWFPNAFYAPDATCTDCTLRLH